MSAATALAAKEAFMKEYSALIEGHRSLQSELQKTISSHSKLQAQYSENESVKEELGRLDDDANVFKLIGPALIKQDLVEARSNVDKRLEYIKGEMERLENQLKGVQSKMADKEKEILKMQKRAQGGS